MDPAWNSQQCLLHVIEMLLTCVRLASIFLVWSAVINLGPDASDLVCLPSADGGQFGANVILVDRAGWVPAVIPMTHRSATVFLGAAGGRRWNGTESDQMR
jgi:hypothetical protein